MKTHVVKLDDLEEFLRENDFQVVRVDKRLWRWPPVVWVKRVDEGRERLPGVGLRSDHCSEGTEAQAKAQVTLTNSRRLRKVAKSAGQQPRLPKL